MTLDAVAPIPPRRLALVLWSGNFGGAETFTVALARALREKGADARIVFVTDPSPLAQRLRAAEVPFEALGLSRGRAVIRHPCRLARATTRAGVDGAVLVEGGYLAAALRLGGYHGKVVAVEHGAILQVPGMRRYRRVVRALDRLSGVRAVDIHVAVSDYVSCKLENGPRPVVTIPNAVDLDMYRPSASLHAGSSQDLVIGCMARFVPGKGIDDVLAAAQKVLMRGAHLRIAGDGPQRPLLEALASRLGVARQVEFLGWVNDASAFWTSCDVGVVPSHQFIESFGLAAVEAMASGRPVIATRNGGLPELVAHDVTGLVVDPGDTRAIAHGLQKYFDDRELLEAHGAAARAWCEQRFDIRRCAESYLALFDEREAA
jgi:glycosyltransferase involved in cell wall biosynthesis